MYLYTIVANKNCQTCKSTYIKDLHIYKVIDD